LKIENVSRECKVEVRMYYFAIGNLGVLASPLGERFKISELPLPIVHDLYPNQTVPDAEDLPGICLPYQRLNAYRWAIPEVYACLPTASGGAKNPCILLSNAAISEEGVTWPSLPDCWSKATVLTQIGWLAQISRLWDACGQENVATSLLDLNNIAVQGWQIRLYKLQSGREQVSLQQLGSYWQALPSSNPQLRSLIDGLAAGQFPTAMDLEEALETLALQVSGGKVLDCASQTHPGRRANNEDCYEAQGRFAIVCDGMGGHEGGEVASRMAVESMDQDLKTFNGQGYSPATLRKALLECVHRANQGILEVNQSQQRSGVGQMGTTVVTYFLDGPLLHIAHAGDSRIYIINRQHCQQLTVDQDVANREMSLAHLSASAADSMLGGGTLTQAVGILNRNSFQPIAQTFVLSEECLILLCSDGFCDGDLVENIWRKELLPLLDTSLQERSQGLIDLALRELGHDNITFVLFKFIPQQPITETTQVAVELPTIPQAVQTSIPQRTEAPAPGSGSRFLVGSFVGVVAIASVASFFVLSQQQKATSVQPSVPSVTTAITPSSPPSAKSNPDTASLSSQSTTSTTTNKSTP
jgi:protein phosphatase